MVRMRTLTETMSYIRKQDPETCITPYALRRMVKTGEIPSFKSGAKYLINIDTLENYLNTPLSATDSEPEYGIRRISR
jgi:excisionase family DNA binding protein